MIVHAARADDSLLALRSARRDGPHRQRARATGRSRALTLSAFRLLSPAAPALPSSPSVENFLANSRSGFYGSERPVTVAHCPWGHATPEGVRNHRNRRHLGTHAFARGRNSAPT